MKFLKYVLKSSDMRKNTAAIQTKEWQQTQNCVQVNVKKILKHAKVIHCKKTVPVCGQVSL